MTVAALLNCRNEADIIGINLRHLIAQGVWRFYIHDDSTDGTTEEIEKISQEIPGRVFLFQRRDSQYEQAERMNSLARMASADGADWLLPFDADEFFYAEDGRTIEEALADVSPEVRKLYCTNWQHHDWDHREVEPIVLPKVVIRPTEGAEFKMGQHEVDGISGGAHGVLAIRHLQYRNFEHFVRKIRDSSARMTAETRARGDGHHIWKFESFSDEELEQEWIQMQAVETVLDPIPVSR